MRKTVPLLAIALPSSARFLKPQARDRDCRGYGRPDVRPVLLPALVQRKLVEPPKGSSRKHARIGVATPAGLLPFVAAPHLRPFPSTGVTRCPQSYGTLRLPADLACPSRDSDCCVQTSKRASGVASSFICHTCRRQDPGGCKSVLVSLTSRLAGGLPLFAGRSAPALPFRGLHGVHNVPARMVAESPKAAPCQQRASVYVVTKMNRPGCCQRERQLLGGVRTRQKKAPLHGAQ